MAKSGIAALAALTCVACAPGAHAQAVAPDKVAFYFAAHQDDWQLFMNPSAFRDVADGKTKAVFIHMTAGDVGLGIKTGGRKFPLYIARENGAEAAIRFMADSDDSRPIEKVAVAAQVNGHAIYRVAYRNTVAYFLRVPDGNFDGAGFVGTGNQSLQRLSESKIAALSAVDGSTSYRDWSDLVATIRAIIDSERGKAPAVSLNVAELDPLRNPNDHSDHLMTARAALEAARDLGCARKLHYIDYASAKLAENLTAQDRDMESSVFAVTLAGVNAFDHPTAWQRYDHKFVGRNYFRTEEPAGPCSGSVAETAPSRAAFAGVGLPH